MKKRILIFSIILIAGFVSGCTVAVNVEMVSERTALENQVLGSYNSIDREMLLVASVRGVDSKGNIKKTPAHSQDHKDAVSAMQIQSFHADDIRFLKQLGWIGEGNNGLLSKFEMDKEKIPEDLKDFSERLKPEEFNYIVSEVNRSRQVIMQRVIDINENMTVNDLQKIQKIFGKLNAENALPGEKFQTEEGAWVVKNEIER